MILDSLFYCKLKNVLINTYIKQVNYNISDKIKYIFQYYYNFRFYKNVNYKLKNMKKNYMI